MTKINLPKEFIAFDELEFCSNILQNCNIPIAIKNEPVILIGKGERPQIWLWGLLDRKSSLLVPLVYCNSIMMITAPIKVESEKNYTRVKLKDTIIIEALKHLHSEEKAMVDQLDMRPLGFNIYGNSSTLHVGTSVMVRNRITGGNVFIALGH